MSKGPAKVVKRKWPKAANDWYVEEPWCAERLFQAEKFEGEVWDPCAGLGTIPAAAAKVGLTEIFATDLAPKPREFWRYPLDAQHDFMTGWPRTRVENIVSNPPFGLCGKRLKAGQPSFPFVRRALEMAERKVALLLPLGYLAGERRAAFLRREMLAKVYVLTPRPSMPPGEAIIAGDTGGMGGLVDFAWFVFVRGHNGAPTLHFLNK